MTRLFPAQSSESSQSEGVEGRGGGDQTVHYLSVCVVIKEEKQDQAGYNSGTWCAFLR
jgi:hypothetical protein